MHGWKITHDHLAKPGEENRAGTAGGRRRNLPTVNFRLRDDDDILYYEGWLEDDPEADNQLSALEFGMANAGCTYIEVERVGFWIQEIS